MNRARERRASGIISASGLDGSEDSMREQLAYVAFRGLIRERTVEPYLRILRSLRERRRVKGVLLDISSGGGEAIASTDFFLGVKRLDSAKPVVASIGAIGASGAYMAALGARKIYAYPESAVGSIGVIFPQFAARDLLRRLGISVELLHVGEHKDAYQGYRPLTETERAKLQAVAQESYDTFVALVARERKRPVEEIRNLATGEFWSGFRSMQLGLVDAVGDHEMALEELARLTGVSVRKTIRVAPPRSFLERMFGGGVGAMASGLADRMHESFEDALVDGGSLGLWK
jgi:protease IV